MMIELYAEVLVDIDPSLPHCIDTVLKQHSQPLLLLLDFHQISTQFQQNLESLFVFNNGRSFIGFNGCDSKRRFNCSVCVKQRATKRRPTGHRCSSLCTLRTYRTRVNTAPWSAKCWTITYGTVIWKWTCKPTWSIASAASDWPCKRWWILPGTLWIDAFDSRVVALLPD